MHDDRDQYLWKEGEIKERRGNERKKLKYDIDLKKLWSTW